MKNGKFIVVDGLDGIGKGVVLKTIVSYLKKNGKRVLDLHQYWKKHGFHPDFSKNKDKVNDYYIDLNNYDVIYSSEPTYVGIGKMIREEIVANNQRFYSSSFTAESYSIDRLVLYQRVIIPALKADKIVLQSRSFSTSIVYQSVQSEDENNTHLTVAQILNLSGNKLALNNIPNLLIIPTIKDVNILLERLDTRDKKDNCFFEKLNFQKKIKPIFEGSKLREIFESRGCVVKYLDAGISITSTKQQALDLYKEVIED